MSIIIRSAQTVGNGVTLRGNNPQYIPPVTLPILFELDASNYSSPLSTWQDISGNGRHATLHGTVPYYTDSVGGYFGFSGNGANYIDIAGSGSGWGIRDVAPNATFSIWANITPNNSYQEVAGWRDGGFNFYFLILNGTPGVVTEARFDGGFSYDLNVDYTSYFNTWAYVTFTVDSVLSQTKLYINGNIIGNRNDITGLWDATDTPFTIGMSYNGSFPLNGYIGGAIAYSRALTDAEVVSEFNRTKTRYGA